MNNSFNISDHPQIMDVLTASAKKIIEVTEQNNYKNPCITCELKVDDGRVFKLTFERTDLDCEPEHWNENWFNIQKPINEDIEIQQ